MVKACLHFLGRGVIHPGALNANQGTHVAILLWSFFFFFFPIFFSPEGNKSGFELKAFVHPRGALAPLQPPAGEGEEPLPACGKLWEARARRGACPGGGAALLPAVAADWEPGGNGCL